VPMYHLAAGGELWSCFLSYLGGDRAVEGLAVPGKRGSAETETDRIEKVIQLESLAQVRVCSERGGFFDGLTVGRDQQYSQVGSRTLHGVPA
jgi:hypothetical protein